MNRKKALLIVLGIEVLVYSILFGVIYLRSIIHPCFTGGKLATPEINLLTYIIPGLVGLAWVVFILKRKDDTL